MSDGKLTLTLTTSCEYMEHALMKVTLDGLFVDTLPKPWEEASREHLKVAMALAFVEGEHPCLDAGCEHAIPDDHMDLLDPDTGGEGT